MIFTILITLYILLILSLLYIFYKNDFNITKSIRYIRVNFFNCCIKNKKELEEKIGVEKVKKLKGELADIEDCKEPLPNIPLDLCLSGELEIEEIKIREKIFRTLKNRDNFISDGGLNKMILPLEATIFLTKNLNPLVSEEGNILIISEHTEIKGSTEFEEIRMYLKDNEITNEKGELIYEDNKSILDLIKSNINKLNNINNPEKKEYKQSDLIDQNILKGSDNQDPFASIDEEINKGKEDEDIFASIDKEIESKEEDSFASIDKEIESKKEEDPFASIDKEIESKKEEDPFASIDKEIESKEEDSFASIDKEIESKKEEDPFAGIDKEIESKKEEDPFASIDKEIESKEKDSFASIDKEIESKKEEDPFASIDKEINNKKDITIEKDISEDSFTIEDNPFDDDNEIDFSKMDEEISETISEMDNIQEEKDENPNEREDFYKKRKYKRISLKNLTKENIVDDIEQILQNSELKEVIMSNIVKTKPLIFNNNKEVIFMDMKNIFLAIAKAYGIDSNKKVDIFDKLDIPTINKISRKISVFFEDEISDLISGNKNLNRVVLERDGQYYFSFGLYFITDEFNKIFTADEFDFFRQYPYNTEYKISNNGNKTNTPLIPSIKECEI